jgi:hypothetical protein
MYYRFLYFLLLILFILRPTFVFTDSKTFHTNEIIELSFTSTNNYTNFVKDVTLQCIFYNKTDTIKVYGFWNGDSTYLVRVSINEEGDWNYKTICSDETNTGLHSQSGTIKVLKYNGSNPLQTKWPIKVSPTGRYLVYNNGDPFFYLGDTAWEMTWKSYSDEVRKYISDRKKKGFNVCQVVAMSHQLMYDYGIENRQGEKFVIDNDFSKLNPRYFDYLDTIVKIANDSGIVVALVPLWAGMSEVNYNNITYRKYFSKEQSLNLAKYIGARYAGSYMIWIVGGDNFYDTPERKSFWSTFGDMLKNATGNRHLLTCHPGGWSSSSDFFDNNTKWLDFHMYQSSHVASGNFTWIAAQKEYKLNPPKPIIDGEANFEDIYNRLNLEGDSTQIETFRIKPVNVRQASYESILSGALVGITYGGNGVWQWNTTELPGGLQPRLTVLEAIKMPGSNNMTVVRTLMEKYQWYSFVPKPEVIKDFLSKENFIPAAENNKIGIIYIPRGTSYIKLIEENNFLDFYSFWINPVTGDSSGNGYYKLNTSITPPDTNDWILIFDKNNYNIKDINWANLDENIKYSNNFPNPFNSQTLIKFALSRAANISMKIYDILGREVFDAGKDFFEAGIQTIKWEPKNNSSGAYFYVIKSDNSTKTGKMILIR